MAKIQNTDNAESMWVEVQQELLLLVECNTVGPATLEGSWAVSYKTSHTLTIRFSSCIP